MSASALAARIVAATRDVPDFPKPGILFKDLTPILRDGDLFEAVIAAIAAPFAAPPITRVAGIESRGFILGAGVALRLGVGFVPLRKAGKLPWERLTRAYALEYGSAELEVHADACYGDEVLIVDDVLATGGTAAAACELVESAGGRVAAIAVLLELSDLRGRDRLPGRSVLSVARI